MTDRATTLASLALYLDSNKYALALIPTVAAFLFGNDDSHMIGLAATFVALDLLTGVLKGGLWQRLSSRIAACGFRKKIGFFLFVAVGHLLDCYLQTGHLIRDLFAKYVIGMETISILENLIAAGVPVPTKVRTALQAVLAGTEERTEETLAVLVQQKGANNETGTENPR